MVSVFYPQEKNKSKIDNYLKNNFSLKSNQYSVKSSIETNPNYDVYYVQQKFNNIDVHNAISTMAIKNGEVKSNNTRFVDDSRQGYSVKSSKCISRPNCSSK